jgi:tRNA(Ile)-lysidine synthase
MTNKFSQKSIYGKVCQTIQKYSLIKKGDRVVVALSGGPDSIALFHILVALREKLSIEISACHFNHRLRGEASESDEKFVKEKCQILGIDCIFGRAEGERKYNNENEARNARYDFFQKILKEGRGDSIAIAHNRNDQAETVMMRIARGTGIRGLKSIPYKRENFVRPLLDISRKEIEEFLKKENIPFVIDETNLSNDYLRNEIRANLIPYLANINPNILDTLANISKSASCDYDFIESSAKKEMNNIILKDEKDTIYFDYYKWLNLHSSLQAMVLRLALERISSLDNITVDQLEEALLILKKGVGKKFKLLPHSLIIELRDGKIVIAKH